MACIWPPRKELLGIAELMGADCWKDWNQSVEEQQYGIKLSVVYWFRTIKGSQGCHCRIGRGVIPQDQIQGGLTTTPIARDILQSYFAKYQIHSQSISN